VVAARQAEADAFYAGLTPEGLSDDGRLVMRQGLAGMLWTKQFYAYDVGRWLEGHGLDPASQPAKRGHDRNRQWFHLTNGEIISMSRSARERAMWIS
jgi:hypothetical protein